MLVMSIGLVAPVLFFCQLPDHSEVFAGFSCALNCIVLPHIAFSAPSINITGSSETQACKNKFKTFLIKLLFQYCLEIFVFFLHFLRETMIANYIVKDLFTFFIRKFR